MCFTEVANWAPDNMPEAASRTNIRTSETSTLPMAIYKWKN